MSELKECPFCGGKPEIKDCRLVWMVICDCGVSVLGDRAPEPDMEKDEKYWEFYRDSAITAWNTRTTSDNRGE